MRYADRRDAGRRLAPRVAALELADPVVLGLPRGGVPVAFEVARHLGAPLDVLVVRKLGAPFQPELGVGALAEGGTTLLEGATLAALRLKEADLTGTIAREEQELHRRVERYRGTREALDVAGRSVIVVDDGLATGVSARAALRAVRSRGPAALILAVPVGPVDADEIMAGEADRVVVAQQPRHLMSVGQWYEDFDQTPDSTVVALLERARHDR